MRKFLKHRRKDSGMFSGILITRSIMPLSFACKLQRNEKRFDPGRILDVVEEIDFDTEYPISPATKTEQ